MYTLGSYSKEFMDAFEAAIRLDPTDRRAYEMAINYTLPQWGGSLDAQDEVLALAEKNMADKTWHEYIHKMYVSERPLSRRVLNWVKSSLTQPRGALVAILLFVAAVVVVLRVRAATRKN